MKSHCIFAGCERPASVRGLCPAHYHAFWRAGKKEPPPDSPTVLAAGPIRAALLHQHLPTLAKVAGVSQVHLYGIRRGSFLPTAKMIAKIKRGMRYLTDKQGVAPDLVEWTRAQGDKIGVRELAHKAGVSYVALTRYLARRGDVTTSRTAQRLARYRKKTVSSA
jgi:hypothetical protein